MRKLQKRSVVVGSAVIAIATAFASWAAAQQTLGCTRDFNISSGFALGQTRGGICADNSGNATIQWILDGSPNNTYTVKVNLTKVVPAGQKARGFMTPSSGIATCDKSDTNPSQASVVQANCALADTNPPVSFSLRVGDNSGS